MISRDWGHAAAQIRWVHMQLLSPMILQLQKKRLGDGEGGCQHWLSKYQVYPNSIMHMQKYRQSKPWLDHKTI